MLALRSYYVGLAFFAQVGWWWVGSVGLPFCRGVGLPPPPGLVNQCMINRGVVLFVSAGAVLPACAVVALVGVALVFARVVVGAPAGAGEVLFVGAVLFGFTFRVRVSLQAALGAGRPRVQFGEFSKYDFPGKIFRGIF